MAFQVPQTSGVPHSTRLHLLTRKAWKELTGGWNVMRCTLQERKVELSL